MRLPQSLQGLAAAAVLTALLPVIAIAGAPPAHDAGHSAAAPDHAPPTTDYLEAKLAIDSQIDPSQDNAWVRAEVAKLAQAAKDQAGPDADDPAKLRAVRKVIYVAGPWNDNRPFGYDMSDQLGRILKNKLLANYLKTRLGNCVSMPVLFLILADRLGVNVTLARAPYHEFVRAIGPNGGFINIETASGGYPSRDAWYRETNYISDDAIRNGIYLRTLSRSETLVVMKEPLLQWQMERKRYEDALATVAERLEMNPRDGEAFALRGIVYGRMIETEFAAYPEPRMIPLSYRPRFEELVGRSNADIDNAHKLGWLDESEWPTKSKLEDAPKGEAHAH